MYIVFSPSILPFFFLCFKFIYKINFIIKCIQTMKQCSIDFTEEIIDHFIF